MSSWLFEALRRHFQEWGYWTVLVTLLLENAGVPLPGETVLLFASFLAFSERRLYLPYVMLIAVAACTLGDNCGYLIGHFGGRPLLERYKHIFRIRDLTIRRGEKLFARHGSLAIFFARFIFGMRIIAGPLAGVLRMPWRHFFVFNFLGAVAWVSAISVVGYLFGSQWDHLVLIFKRVDTAILLLVAVLVLFLWWRRRQQQQEREAAE
jgi:membrane protein DedA with SNARE-associated domain